LPCGTAPPTGMDVDVDVIVDVVVDCWLYACAREAGRLPLWIEFLALSARTAYFLTAPKLRSVDKDPNSLARGPQAE